MKHKCYSLLKIMWGWAKMHKLGLLITAGAVLIPLGFFIIIQYPEYKNYCTASVLLGLVAWLVAYFIADKRERKENEQRKRLESQSDKIVELLDSINDKLSKGDETTKSK